MGFKVGDKLRIYFDENNRNNRLLHVLAIVDDRVMVKYWKKHKHGWIYDIEPVLYLRDLQEFGHLKKV